MIGLPFMARMGRKIAQVPCMAMNVLPHRLRLDEDAPLPDWLAAQSKAMAQGRRRGLYRSEFLRRELVNTGLVERTPDCKVYRRVERRPPLEALALIRRLDLKGRA